MRTNCHSDQRPAYDCSGRADRATTRTCRSVAVATVDDAVAGRLLAALNPDEVALALAAADEVADRHHRLGRAAELAVERAHLEGPTAPSEPSAPLNPKIVWSHGRWRFVGKPNSPPSPRPNKHWQPHASAAAVAGPPNSNGSPATCPCCGRRRPPATKIESGCCAP
ncbi:hypothetical protein H7I92_13975 [Mycobacterium riyadhense]|nr:hypothetical protein [Mycobacterium riyadhense]